MPFRDLFLIVAWHVLIGVSLQNTSALQGGPPDCPQPPRHNFHQNFQAVPRTMGRQVFVLSPRLRRCTSAQWTYSKCYTCRIRHGVSFDVCRPPNCHLDIQKLDKENKKGNSTRERSGKQHHQKEGEEGDNTTQKEGGERSTTQEEKVAPQQKKDRTATPPKPAPPKSGEGRKQHYPTGGGETTTSLCLPPPSGWCCPLLSSFWLVLSSPFLRWEGWGRGRSAAGSSLPFLCLWDVFAAPPLCGW